MLLPSPEEQIEFFTTQIAEIKKSNLQNHYSILRGKRFVETLDPKEFEKIKQAEQVINECQEMIDKGALYIEVAEGELERLRTL